MIYRIVLGILICGIIPQFSYSQTNDVIAVRDLILEKLNIPNDIYYDNIESAFSVEDISIKVKRYNNKYDDRLNDFLYVLYFNSYQITLYKSATSEKYFITEIEIDANINTEIKSLFNDQAIDRLKVNKDFGHIIDYLSNDDELVYEVAEGWDYLTLYFQNDSIHKILLTFRLE
jgi:hypothetical protein